MSVGVYSALFTSHIQTVLLLRCYVVMHHVTRRLRARADTVRDGTELRATKQMKRGGNPAHSAYCIYLYTEFVLLMQYHCKVYTDFSLLILFLNALRYLTFSELSYLTTQNIFIITVFYGSKILHMLFSMFVYIFWAQLLVTYQAYILLTNCIPNLVFIIVVLH